MSLSIYDLSTVRLVYQYVLLTEGVFLIRLTLNSQNQLQSGKIGSTVSKNPGLGFRV
jgi:hypothetical protein